MVNIKRFQEQSEKQYFTYFELNDPELARRGFDLDPEWLAEQGCTHAVNVSYERAYNADYPLSDWRGAIVKKTVAHIAIDELPGGLALFDKWKIKQK